MEESKSQRRQTRQEIIENISSPDHALSISAKDMTKAMVDCIEDLEDSINKNAN